LECFTSIWYIRSTYICFMAMVCGHLVHFPSLACRIKKNLAYLDSFETK
jgi:hypothetical protein